LNDRLAELKTRAQTLYRRANDLSGGALAIVRQAFKNFGEAQASGAAASVAYYALFSLFPLLLALAAAGSFFLEDEQAYQETIALISNAIPVSQDLIVQNIRQVLASRGAVGLIGLVGLLWSATGVFMNLARNINRAWSHATERGFLKGRLVALAMVGVLALLLILSVLSTALLNLLPRLRIPLLGNLNVYDTALWPIVSGLVPWLFGWLLFLALYRWVPNTSVPWSAALWGAGVASLLWEVAKKGFAWYLEAGLARYSLVYGSLGTVVALMFWLYLSAWITFFGAHLSAAVAQRSQVQKS
jgi:membrane protein